MAHLHEIGPPANDGERRVLRILRDELSDDWHVVGNFSITQGGRTFECDALVIAPQGWAYLVEVKAWTGRIVGNDAQWALPALVGDGISYRPNPLELTELKAKVLATVIREAAPILKGVFIQPIVVLVSETAPSLTGRCANHTVLVADVIARVREDPREYAKKVPDDVSARTAAVLEQNSVPIAPPGVLGSWELIELAAAGPTWEVWSARPRLAGAAARPMRLKRYRLDTLLTGPARNLQQDRARRDLEALQRLNGVDGAAPLVSSVDEIDDSFLVVTEWPDGESLASMLATRMLESEAAEEVLDALTSAMASIHTVGVVHRRLTPGCAHYLRNGRVVITDFDYARIPSGRGGITQHIADELDQPYVAPEVREDPSVADKTSDVWSIARIAVDLFGVMDEHSAPQLTALPGRLQGPLGHALDPDPLSRPSDAELLLSDLRSVSEPSRPLFESFQPNDDLDDRWIVRSEGQGGIASVYKVYDSMLQRDYAAKFVRAEYKSQIDPSEEYRLLADVPDHPGIVRPETVATMHKYRRGGVEYQLRETFLVTRWVEGTRLDRLIPEKLSPVRCVQLALDIADGLQHLHHYGLLHRDLKPSNVIVDGDGKPRLVDFNVSRLVESADRTQTGTPPYRPPDLAESGWNTGCDVFALGYVLCELLAGRNLGSDARSWLESAEDIQSQLRDVLLTATAPAFDQRYASAAAFSEHLRGVLEDLQSSESQPDGVPLPEVPQDELDRPNWNPYQNRLIRLFSQSRETNSGTRGLDEFGRWSYVPTRIDRELLPDALAGKYGLLLITGNAGDGKTAFIQMLEHALVDRGAEVLRRESNNGAEFALGSRRFLTNWDGSQSEAATGNDEVLFDFFGPFAGAEPSKPDGEARVIAINEGRLLDFLDGHRERFPWLHGLLLGVLAEEDVQIPEWVALVNLNLRALTISTSNGGSIVGKLLDRFSDERLWSPCEGCVASSQCYARANAEMLRDPVLGPRVAERIRQTLDLVRLRRRLHITMRDLRSALAFIVAGNRNCNEIVRVAQELDREALLGGHAYNALFAGSARVAGPTGASGAHSDRLLAAVGTLDVARTANPEDDARLWAAGVGAIVDDPPSIERGDRELLVELRDRLPQAASQLSDRRARADIRLLHASLRRKLYVEREDPGWADMLPYERLDVFTRLLRGCSDRDRLEVTRAIANSEGLFHASFDDQIAVRLASETSGADRSYVVHASDTFTLSPLDRSRHARYVEYEPDSLRLQHRGESSLRLDIDLDLFETLSRILNGFTPSREELRGAWLNLQIFKDQLASLATDSLLLSKDDRIFHRVHRSRSGRSVRVEAVT